MSTSPLTEELDETVALLTEKREETLGKVNAELAELETLRQNIVDGRPNEDARTKMRAARRRILGAEDGKRQAQLKTQDVRVRMRAPVDPVGAPAPKVERQARPTVSKVIVQGSIQRELGGLESRIVGLLLDEGGTMQAPEVVFLADLRSGLLGLLKDMPEHDVLLGLVADHVEQVQHTLRDLALGGVARARRFFEHDRELLGRLRAMLRADGTAKAGMPPTVEKMAQALGRSKTVLDSGHNGELTKIARELEDALVTIHRELQDRGFVAARSLLFSALRG